MPDMIGQRINDLALASEMANDMNFITDTGDGTKKVPAGVLVKKVLNSANAGSAADASEVGKFMRSVAEEYDTTATYEVGDYCLYNNVIYRCTTAVGTPGAFNSAQWLAVSIANELAKNLVFTDPDEDGNIVISFGVGG